MSTQSNSGVDFVIKIASLRMQGLRHHLEIMCFVEMTIYQKDKMNHTKKNHHKRLPK